MTETKSSTLNTIKSLLQKMFIRLDESYCRDNSHLSEPIDIQCQCRFGKSWNEVKAQMMQAMSGIVFAGGDKIDPQIAVKGIGLGGGTRNWMTNLYLGVLYLHFIRTPRALGLSINAEPGKPIEVQRVSFDGIIGDAIYDKVVKAIESGEDTEFLHDGKPLYWNLLHIASRVLPDEVEQVLTSHGL